MIKQSPKAVVCNPILAKQSSKNAVNARINFFLNKLNIKSDNRFKALIRICVILFVTLISNYTLQAQFGPNDDFDGDLIINSIDIDDDNDGILDDDENTCSGTVVDVNWNNNQNTNLMGNRESVFQENGVTFSTNDFISSTVDIQFGAGLGTVNTVFPPNNSGSGIYDDQFEYDIRGTADATTFAEAKMNDDYFEFTFTMSQTAYLQNVATGLNPTDFGGTGIADYSLAVEISDDGTFNGNEIILTENTFHESTQNSSSYRYTNIGAGVELTAGVTYTVRYYPFDEQNSLLPDNSITFDDVFMQIECFSDIDGDGIANSFDLDSDDDGCPDVLEAGTLGVNDENGTVENDTLTGGIDMDGVPNIAMGGTTPIDQFDDMLPNFQDSLWKMACQEPFDCLSNAYMVQGVTSEWNDLNLSKGTTEINNDNYLLEINAIGFNLIDSTITGLTVSAPNQNRLSVTTRNTDGTYCTSLSPIITGMPADEYPAGDVDQNGILHVWGDGTMYRIDADPSSATYGTLLSSTTTTGIPTGTLHDWAFSPLDNQIYAVSSNTAQDILYRINPITGVVENLGSNGIEDVNPSDTEQGSGILYGASYFDSDGNFFVQNNTSGKIYRLDLSPAPGADYDESLTVLASQSVGGLISNDGAKCPTSPVSLFIDFSDLEAFGSANHVHCTDATAGVPDNPDAVWLGTLVDFDNNQLNSADALGDDDDGLDDEDAISNFPANLVSGTPSMFTLTLNSNNAVEVFYGVWLDYNGDGNINEFIDGSAMTASPVDVIVNINPNVTVGDSVKVRVRVDTVALVSADINGSKLNGEVEDWIISQGVCPEITMNTISITENDVCMGVAAPTIEGTAPVLDPVTEFTYQWQSRNGTDPFADIASANMEDLMPGVITATTEYRRIVLVDDCPNDTTTVSVTINVNPLPTITNSSTSEVISSGDMSSGFTFVSSPTGATFSWTSAAVGAAGNTALGTGNIPAETLFAIGESVGEVIYTVTPTLNGCDGETVDFTVLVNALPEPDENVTFVNIPVEGDLATNDVLIPMGSTYANLEADVSNPTTDLPTVNADGTYEFETDTPGSYTFEIEITTPEGDIVTETLVITVLDSNSDANPPLANTDQGTTQFDTPVTLSTLSNDLSGDEGVMLDPTTVAVTTGPQNGTVMIDPNTGEITYTPNAGYVGMDTLTYTVLDDNNMLATAQQIITVLPTGADNTTTATDDNGSGLYNDSVSGNVLDNDMDAEGNGQQTTPQTTTISGVGTLELDDMGSYLFTPVAGFFGPVDFPYAVTDDNGSPATDMATLHILISPPTCEDFENGDADICAILSADADSPVGAIDCDEDGNTNAEECLDPNNPSDPGEPCSNLYETGAEVCAFVTANPTSALALADCDGGGVPNVIECTNGGNPLESQDDCISAGDANFDVCIYVLTNPMSELALSDCDGGGVSNILECLAGDDPLDPTDDINPRPDENVTYVEVPVSGNVSTNDMNIPEGSTYGDCFPDPDNPSDAMPLMDENGMFTFESEVPGVFVFQVPVITPDGMEILVDLVITVLDPDIDNNVPVANVDISTTLYETEVTLSTLSNDFTGNLQSPLDPTTVAVIVSPANGMISIDPITGDITYIPNDGFVGTDILTYEVMDEDGNVSIADQIITVLPLNVTNTTTAADDNSTTGYEIPLVGSVSTNDTDAEDNTQFVVPQVITVPEGMLTLYPNGDYTFTPANEFVGPVDFPYEIFDTGGAMDMATLHILVQPPPIGEISGTAWKDANGNGVQETEENLLPGIVAVLEDCDGNMIDLTITNADGEYVFDDVPVGMVRVRFDISALPPDCVFTLQDVGDDTTDSDVNQFGQGPCIDVMQFDEIDNYSVGLIGTSSVIGFVWTDFDGDGNQHNESGIADVTITLLNADGTEYATTTSDENGNYSFVYVPIGDYFVEFTDPDGNTLSLPNATGNDSNDSDAEENGDGTSSSAIFTVSIDGPSQVDAGYYQCAQIGETVWYDVNTNDQEDSNENGLNGMVVNLYTADGILFDSDITGHKPGTPSDDGYYKFCVPPGSYYIEAVLPPQGLVPAQSNQGSDLTDSDITNANGFGTTSTFTVTSGEEKCDIGAGYYPMAEVGNFVWHDEDQNGIQNQGEQPLENVIVQVFDENNQKISEAITDELGKYNVDYLGQTQYYFKFTPPNGYAATTANATVDDYDSDITHAHGANTTNLYSLQSGDVVTHVDAGMALSVLPIEWLSVSADNRGNHNIVKWATSSEINSDYYQIERRMESESDFKSIAKEEAVGFSLDRTDYNYQDHDLSATGNYYYRIKQVDTDGSIDYSDIVVVTISRKEAQLSLYPNPARDVAVITITLDEDTEVAMSFYNADGKLIKSNLTVEQVSPGRYEKSITLDDLLPGVYRVMLRANDRVWNKDLIVVR